MSPLNQLISIFNNQVLDRHNFGSFEFSRSSLQIFGVNRFIVDRLTKSAYFIPVDTRYAARKYAQMYFDQIVTLHGVPLTIIADRGTVFVSRF